MRVGGQSFPLPSHLLTDSVRPVYLPEFTRGNIEQKSWTKFMFLWGCGWHGSQEYVNYYIILHRSTILLSYYTDVWLLCVGVLYCIFVYYKIHSWQNTAIYILYNMGLRVSLSIYL